MLYSGSVELGLAGALTAVEGAEDARVRLLVRTGRFLAAGPGLASGEMEVGYAHQGSIDVLDLQGAVAWSVRLGESAVWPFAGVGGGLQQEWVGSFSQTRYPVGFDLGARILLSQGAGLRLQYRFRQFLSDPVSDFHQQEVLLGVSLLLGNRGPATATGRPPSTAIGR